MTTETDQPVSTQGFYRYHDVIGLLSPAGPGFSGPVAVTTGPDGMLYVANRANPKQPDGVRVSRCTTEAITWTSSVSGARAPESSFG